MSSRFVSRAALDSRKRRSRSTAPERLRRSDVGRSSRGLSSPSASRSRIGSSASRCASWSSTRALPGAARSGSRARLEPRRVMIRDTAARRAAIRRRAVRVRLAGEPAHARVAELRAPRSPRHRLAAHRPLRAIFRAQTLEERAVFGELTGPRRHAALRLAGNLAGPLPGRTPLPTASHVRGPGDAHPHTLPPAAVLEWAPARALAAGLAVAGFLLVADRNAHRPAQLAPAPTELGAAALAARAIGTVVTGGVLESLRAGWRRTRLVQHVDSVRKQRARAQPERVRTGRQLGAPVARTVLAAHFAPGATRLLSAVNRAWLAYRGAVHQIRHTNRPNACEVPDKLKEIEDRIDQLAGSERWIGSGGQPADGGVPQP